MSLLRILPAGWVPPRPSPQWGSRPGCFLMSNTPTSTEGKGRASGSLGFLSGGVGYSLGFSVFFFWDKCRSFSTLFFRSPRTPPLHGTPEVDVYPPPLKPPARGPLRFGPPRPAPRCGPRGVPLHHRRRRRRPRPRLPPPGPHMTYPHTGIFPFCFLLPRPKIQDLFFPLSSFSRFHL